MVNCAVPLCTANADKCRGLTWHRFPTDEKRRKKWLLKIRREEGPHFKLQKWTTICSRHFTEADFRQTEKTRCLTRTAVPSRFEWNNWGADPTVNKPLTVHKPTAVQTPPARMVSLLSKKIVETGNPGQTISVMAPDGSQVVTTLILTDTTKPGQHTKAVEEKDDSDLGTSGSSPQNVREGRVVINESTSNEGTETHMIMKPEVDSDTEDVQVKEEPDDLPEWQEHSDTACSDQVTDTLTDSCKLEEQIKTEDSDSELEPTVTFPSECENMCSEDMAPPAARESNEGCDIDEGSAECQSVSSYPVLLVKNTAHSGTDKLLQTNSRHNDDENSGASCVSTSQVTHTQGVMVTADIRTSGIIKEGSGLVNKLKDWQRQIINFSKFQKQNCVAVRVSDGSHDVKDRLRHRILAPAPTPPTPPSQPLPRLDQLYMCSSCGDGFPSSQDLKYHTMTLHRKKHKCDVCGACFSYHGNLKAHKRVHTGEMPYECTICGRKFNKSGNLNIHVRTHTGEKPYRCEECGKEFARKDHLSAHIKTHTI